MAYPPAGGAGASDLPDLGDVDDTITPTKGHILVPDGTEWKAVPVGADDTVLTADSTQSEGVKWATPSGGGGGGSSGSWEPIEVKDLASNTAPPLSFSGIDTAVYRTFRLLGSWQFASGNRWLGLTFNADAGANYQYQRILADGTSLSTASATGESFARLGFGFDDYAFQVEALITKQVAGWGATVQWQMTADFTTDIDWYHGANFWDNTVDLISSIEVTTDTPGSGTFKSGSRFVLEGMRE